METIDIYTRLKKSYNNYLDAPAEEKENVLQSCEVKCNGYIYGYDSKGAICMAVDNGEYKWYNITNFSKSAATICADIKKSMV